LPSCCFNKRVNGILFPYPDIVRDKKVTIDEDTPIIFRIDYSDKTAIVVAEVMLVQKNKSRDMGVKRMC